MSQLDWMLDTSVVPEICICVILSANQSLAYDTGNLGALKAGAAIGGIGGWR